MKPSAGSDDRRDDRRQTPGVGPKSADLLIVGEAPGAQEVAQRTPFVGPAGQALNRWLGLAGLSRNQARIDNVLQRKPPSNKLDRLPPGELEWWQADFQQRLAELRPRLVVPTGRTALQAITGDTRASIMKQRGSVSWITLPNGHECKMLPILHPAFTFRQPKTTKWCERDWKRAARELSTPDLRLPDREHFIAPTLDDVRWWTKEVLSDDCRAVLSVDLEVLRRVTWVEGGVSKRTGKPLKPKRRLTDPRIVCAGFALNENFSFVVPTTEEFWGSVKKSKLVWDLVAECCESKAQKVLQNGLFDAWWLAWEQGIGLPNYLWDCKAMHHAIDAADDHDLAYLTSYYTDEPYYKDEAKDPDESQRWVGAGSEQLWVYCGKDAAVEWEIASKLHEELSDSGRLDWYLKHYTNCQPAMLEMMLNGVSIDHEWREAKWNELQRSQDQRRQAITKWCGVDLYGKKTLSNKKLQEFLYGRRADGGMGLPKRRDRKTGNLTVKEVVIRQLMQRHDELAIVGQAILDQRREAQLQTFVSEGRVNPDTGRMHSAYGFTPKTGRFSSTKAPDRSGCNLQNQDREVRGMYVPEPGRVLVEGDLSQAESRVVQVLTGDPELLEFALAKPWEFDVHTYNASVVFGIPEDRVTELQRYIGKKAVHASNYGMHGRKLAEELLKEGYVYADDECSAMIEAYHARYPAIRYQWQRRVRQTVLKLRYLENCFGRRLSFNYARLGDEVWREAYAFEPQSTIADLLNQDGLVPCHQEVKRRWPGKVSLLGQIHDALLFSAEPSRVAELMVMVKRALEVPIVVGGVELVIPVEFKVGRSWGDCVKWKQLPTKAEVTRVALSQVRDTTAQQQKEAKRLEEQSEQS